jgi:Transposase DNA-binding/Transposase Tn5 dimerisation domain
MLEERGKKQQRRKPMDEETLQQSENWAVATFGAAELGDPRRTDRLVKVASALAKNPSASLPHASETWGETLGAYRFLNNPTLGYEDIIMAHWTQTYHEAAQGARTLLLADTTEMDFSTHSALEGLAPIGNSRENIGFSVHTVLAMNPQTQQILGCLTQEPFRRNLAPKGETKAQRRKRDRESQVWEHSVQHIGRVPENCQWVYVGDSGSDVFTFWQHCEQLGYDFVLRVAQDRVIEIPAGDAAEELDETHLKTLARALPSQEAHAVTIAAHHHHPKREALLQMSFQKVCVHPPLNGAFLQKTQLTAWVVRVWETHPPEGVEPLEWILLSTIPILVPADAWEVVEWYGLRWTLEDFHKALKTGCHMEKHFLQTVQAQWRLLAILTPIALRLLQIRTLAQQASETPATDAVSPDVVQVVTLLQKRPCEIVTAKHLWHAIARLGGYLDRKCDGPPGWQTLWKGWMRIMDVLEGVHLALHFSSS